MRIAAIMAAISIALSAGDWISARWTQAGDVLTTKAKYRGLYTENGNTITDGWKAGYRPDFRDSLALFTDYPDFDGEGLVTIYNMETGKAHVIHKGKNIGPASFTFEGEIVFSDGETTWRMDRVGNVIESFTGGAYIVVPVANGYIWCDREGKAFHRHNSKIHALDIENAFAPIVSDNYRLVLFQRAGEGELLYDVESGETLTLPQLDKPVFAEGGILGLRLVDDGHDITESSIYYVSLKDEMEAGHPEDGHPQGMPLHSIFKSLNDLFHVYCLVRGDIAFA